jgi:hypothetical protein
MAELSHHHRAPIHLRVCLGLFSCDSCVSWFPAFGGRATKNSRPRGVSLASGSTCKNPGNYLLSRLKTLSWALDA